NELNHDDLPFTLPPPPPLPPLPAAGDRLWLSARCARPALDGDTFPDALDAVGDAAVPDAPPDDAAKLGTGAGAGDRTSPFSDSVRSRPSAPAADAAADAPPIKITLPPAPL